MNTHDEIAETARTESAGALSNGSEPPCCEWEFLHGLQTGPSYRAEVLPFRHLSRSIAFTRKPMKNNGWCYAVFLASDLQVGFFDGISDGKSFSAIPAPGSTVN
jgi:hypothetical protein